MPILQYIHIAGVGPAIEVRTVLGEWLLPGGHGIVGHRNRQKA